jgi:hypothetical protein
MEGDSTGSPPRKECYDCKVIARPMLLQPACWLSGFSSALVCAANCEAPRANWSLKRAPCCLLLHCAAGPPSVCLFKKSAQEAEKCCQVRFVRGWCQRSAACSSGAAPRRRWRGSIDRCACSLAGNRAPCQYCGRRGRMCGREETQKSRGGW